jgi:hypothetical protein
MKSSRGEVFGDSLGISHVRNTDLESMHMCIWMSEMRGRERDAGSGRNTLDKNVLRDNKGKNWKEEREAGYQENMMIDKG